jgi:hypothetical protein
LVVAIDEFTGRRVYTIDDSSGACIECTVKMPISTVVDGNAAATGDTGPKKVDANPPLPTDPFPTIDVGCVVDIKGGLSSFRDKRLRSGKRGSDSSSRFSPNRGSYEKAKFADVDMKLSEAKRQQK